MKVMDQVNNEYYERVASKELPFVGTHYETANPLLKQFLDYLQLPPDDSAFSAPDFTSYMQNLDQRIIQAFENNEDDALLEVHLIMYTIYDLYFMNPVAKVVKHLNDFWVLSIKSKIEKAWMKKELKSIEGLIPSSDLLVNFEALRSWLITTSEDKHSVNDRISVFFKDEATKEDIKKFVHIDQHLNHRFYDAITLSLLHFSESVKTEISHHYWEEAGEGSPTKAHTYQFTKILDHNEIPINSTPPWNDWRAFAGFNIYFLFALNREHYFKSIGSLGMPELFDVDRDGDIVTGLRRLGEDVDEHYFYYIAHVEMDAEHGAEWLDEIIQKLVDQEPESAEEIAIGALIRMKYMRLFNQYLIKTFNMS